MTIALLFAVFLVLSLRPCVFSQQDDKFEHLNDQTVGLKAETEEAGEGSIEDPANIMDSDPFLVNQYILTISGSVFNEKFFGARAIMNISTPSGFDENPYLLIIEGYPQKNSRNTFFWNSEGEEMQAISNNITITIKNTAVMPSDTHFFFLSPVLYEQAVAEGHHQEEEIKKAAEKGALPTRIYAIAGQLKLNIHATSVYGTIWLKGYDHIQKSYVMYSGQISGSRSVKLQPKGQTRQ